QQLHGIRPLSAGRLPGLRVGWRSARRTHDAAAPRALHQRARFARAGVVLRARVLPLVASTTLRTPMEPTFGSLTFMFPMWNEEEMIHRTGDAARETPSDLVASG